MRDYPTSIMVFSAGLGTRMGALTEDRPKPMIEVARKPLIDHALEQVRAFGVERIVVNLHYKPDAIRHHLAGSEILYSEEIPEILETGGGLRAALPLLGADPVFTMNTDMVWSGPNPLALLAENWNPAHMDALLLCIPPERATGHDGPGDFVIAEDGRATRGAGAVYSGLQIIKTEALYDIAEPVFSISRLWDKMVADERLFALLYPGEWCDVGRPEGIGLAEDMLHYSDV